MTQKLARRIAVLALAALTVGSALPACGDDDGAPVVCGDGVVGAGEQCDDGNLQDGDGCDAQCALESCGDGECGPAENSVNCLEDCPLTCAALDDVSDLVDSGELFFGYPVLGVDVATPACGGFGTKELYVELTPTFTGDLVLSTVHPSTATNTVIELRGESCDGSALGCNDDADAQTQSSRVTIAVEAGQRYVAVIEADDDEAGVFALGVHRRGVCEGHGVASDVTADLLTGRRLDSDSAVSTSSQRGSCGSADDNPEVLYTFTAPRSGVMVATTVLPGTDYDTALYVREAGLDGTPYCDSPEAEVACADDSAPWGSGAVLDFDVIAGQAYSLFVDGSGAGAQGNAGLVLGYRATSPASASLGGCDHTGIRDRFAFFAQSGQTVYVNVDTVDAETAADHRLMVLRPDGSELYEADDDVACTFPPPNYSCPEHTFTADAAGLYYVDVYVGSSESCYSHSLANYLLTVTVDGQQAELILFKDQ